MRSNRSFLAEEKLSIVREAEREGNATVYFGDIFGKKSQLAELKSKKIQTMRVWTNDSYVEKDFTKENQDEFYNVINCLTK